MLCSFSHYPIVALIMTRPSAKTWVVVALILGIGAWLIVKRDRGGHSSQRLTTQMDPVSSPPAAHPPDSGTTRKYLALDAAERERDATLWANEILAEEYEDVFVRLWDELRQQQDRFAVLKRFPIGSLHLGLLGRSEAKEDGIVVARQVGSGEKLDSLGWGRLLDQWRSEGWSLEQSEWRNPRFDPGTNGPPKSTILMTLHALNAKLAQRVVVKANLEVEWQTARDADGRPAPRTIEVTQMEVRGRQGATAFVEAVNQTIQAPPGTIFVDPLILYDLDGDGLSEIILGAKNLVYWNRGGGRFDSAQLCSAAEGTNLASVVADFDGDGRAGFLAADRAGLMLYPGGPTGAFSSGRRVWSAPQPLWNPFVITAGDVNGDGHLDVFLAQYKVPYLEGQMPTPYFDANDGFPSYLLLNDGRGGFSDITSKAGLEAKRFRRTYSASLVDLDNDGKLDLLVVSDFAGVDVYLGDGHGRFTDATARLIDEPRNFGMAHSLADFDGDGRLDLLVIGMNSAVTKRLEGLGLRRPGFPAYDQMRAPMSQGNRLYFGREGRFVAGPLSAQVAESGWSWGTTAFDFDNDRDLDIYIANGHISRQSAKDYEPQFWLHDIYLGASDMDPGRNLYFQENATQRSARGQSYGGYEKNRLFVNQGGHEFVEAGYLMGVSLEEDCRDVVSDDLDGDGRLDLVLTTLEQWPATIETLRVLHNRCESAGNWIGVHLRESGPGLSPVGARVTLTTSAGAQNRWLVTGDSHRSQHAPTAHFGLGALTNALSLEVRWPNGHARKIENPVINRYHTIMP